ncbi:MAG TPA: dockerin type I domain-containing protein [Pseudobacteroides sp.]|uniref:dockerin type I domain-containing protein n=1 Tax=Pseudobacteroides sp. TaxID=1968840 RepID=UPI002F949C40
MKQKAKIMLLAASALIVFSYMSISIIAETNINETSRGKWMAGDFHNHTYLTDGSYSASDVARNAFENFGLNWMANSEHGGYTYRDTGGNYLPMPVPRWISLKDYSYPVVQNLRKTYSDKLLVQGVEWNVPTHDHASIGIVSDEPTAISDFEYMFDASDSDTSRSGEGLTKANVTHSDAVNAVKWLGHNYPKTSYFIINHPSRVFGYSISDIRDFNNAAPDVAFGFEGIPGHQKSAVRGEYPYANYRGTTYGGADYMIAKVGGVWDALLGEGRHFYNFINSDFHYNAGDFWPGEYAKNYTWVDKQNDYNAIVEGMRSGRSFTVQGDLINVLEFTASSGKKVAQMGGDLMLLPGENGKLTIKFKSPVTNNNGDKPSVHHIDLIAGDITGAVQPGTPEYRMDRNDSTKIAATFTSKDWIVDQDGYNVITYDLGKVSKSQYFRLRGTNLEPGIPNQTDVQGNPLDDKLLGINDARTAYQDLWFYSNPIFVRVERPSLTLSRSIACPAKETSINLSMDNLNQLAGIKMKLTYDPGMLSVKSVVLADQLAASVVNTSVPGEIHFNAINTTGISTKSLDIGTFTFRVNSDIGSQNLPINLPICVAEAEACDIRGQIINLTAHDGARTIEKKVLPEARDVTFTGEAVTGGVLAARYRYIDGKNRPETGTTFRWLAADHGTGNYIPIKGAETNIITITKDLAGKDIKVEVTPRNAEDTGAAAAGDNGRNLVIRLGDVNKDGKVSYIDALLTMHLITGKIDLDSQSKAAADLNRSNEADINDVVRILRSDVGLVP